MNKSIKIVIGILIGLLILWGIIFAIDYNRCSNMKEPIFAISKKENDLSIKSITYQCLGYRVEVVKNVSDEYGEQITKVEMYMFNKFIAGAIANSNTNEETIDNDIVIIKNGNINDEDLINDFINKVNDSSNKEEVVLKIREYTSEEEFKEKELKFTPGSNENNENSNTVVDGIPDNYEKTKKRFGYYSLTLNNDYNSTETFNGYYWKLVKSTKDGIIKFRLEANKFIDVTEFPVICSYSLESSNYRKKFDLTYYQRKDMGLEKIIDNKENDNYDFDVYTFGGDVSITIDSDMVFDLKEALEQNIITVDKIIEQCKIDEEYGICFSNFYKDGGSIEYCYNNYTILKYNTLDGNKDLVIGFKGQIINMVNEKINI